MGTKNPDIVTNIAFDNKGIWIRTDENLGGWATGWKWKEDDETSEDTLIEQTERDFGITLERGEYRFITHTLKENTGVDFYITKIRRPKKHMDFDFERITFNKFEKLLQGVTYKNQTMSEGYMETQKEIIKELEKELTPRSLEINTIGLQFQRETLDQQLQLEWNLQHEYKMYKQKQHIAERQRAQINRIRIDENLLN